MTQLSSSLQQLESGAQFVLHDLKGREKGKLREVNTAATTANRRNARKKKMTKFFRETEREKKGLFSWSSTTTCRMN